jgi:hypothetical protein
MQNSLLEIWEVVLAPLYLIVAYSTVLMIRKSDRRIFTLGLSAKMIGLFGFVFVYLVYYGGGDTVSYYKTALPMLNLFYSDFSAGLSVYMHDYNPADFSYFTQETGYPLRYIFADRGTLMVSKIVMPFLIFSFKSYLLASILIATVSYLASWKLFGLFRVLIVGNSKLAMIAVLFIPSILFWGSGISKDTISYASMCYFIYGMYWIVIRRRFALATILLSVLSLTLIIVIKPYIFLVLFPGALVWIFNSSIQSIRTKFIRISMIPFIVALSLGVFAVTFSSISATLGDYSTEKIINKAVVTQEDFKREYYGSNSFDIGTIERTPLGVISKFPIATLYGFYGPSVLSINNIVMLFSALENTFLLLLTFGVLFRNNPLKLMNRIISEPFLAFCLMFSVFFAFGIGLTTPNYGALVRFKIPLIPFFTILLLVLYTKAKIFNPKNEE